MSTAATIPAPAAPGTSAAPASTTTIMIVEDTPFWQNQIEQAVRAAGFATVVAGNGIEALALIDKHKPAVIVSDIEMPQMGGLDLMKALRSRPQWQKLPIILLTTVVAKDRVIEASRLRTAEYIVKGSFSAEKLVQSIKKWLNPPKAAAPAAAAKASPNAAAPVAAPRPAVAKPAAAPAAKPAAPAPAKSAASAVPRLLQRNEVLAAVPKHAVAGKTLANVIAQATELCKKSASNPTALLEIIKYDPIFAMRLIQQANAIKRVGTIEEAVRVVGVEAMQKIAESLAPYPATSRYALGMWQHSAAVASVMHKIVPRSFEMSAGVAYLIGLLHDLPEIVLRQAFPAQFEAAADFADQAGRTVRSILPDVFSVTLGDVANDLLALMKLPPLISTPLREYAAGAGNANQSAPGDRLALALRFADSYANALRLTASPSEAMIAPLTLAECRTAFVATDAINGGEIRANVMAACKNLAGDAIESPPPAAPLRIWYVRHISYAPLDPVEEALKVVADVQTHAEPPSKHEHFANLNGVVVSCPAIDTYGLLWFAPDRMSQGSAGGRPKVLYILPSGANADAKRPAGDDVHILRYPFAVSVLEETLKIFTR